MKAATLIWHELQLRRGQAGLAALAMMAAVALSLIAFAVVSASTRETTRNMRDLGYNLRIIPKDTDLNRFWSDGHPQGTFAEDVVDQFLSSDNVTYNHVQALLQSWVDYQGTAALLTGMAPEFAAPGKKKSPMIFSVEPGTASIGAELAAQHGIERGQAIEVSGVELTVDRVLAAAGSQDDVRLFVALSDAQAMLEVPGQINEIRALNCLCMEEGKDTFAQLEAELEILLPEARVVQMRALHEARLRQRTMAVRLFEFLIPVVLLGCAVCLGALAWWNVRERRDELGVLRALGYSTGFVQRLVLGRAALVGLIGAVIGGGVGLAVCAWATPTLFPVMAAKIELPVSAAGWVVLAAPLFAATMSWIPATVAASLDPADALREG